MSDQMSSEKDVETGASSAQQEREESDNTEYDSLPIGTVLRGLRGERTLRGRAERDGNRKQLPVQR